MAALTPLLQALKYIPASVGIKALEKINPKFKNYFTQAAAYGFDTDRALKYISDRFENENSQDFRNRLATGGNQLRPEEQVAKTQIAHGDIPGDILRKGLSYGGAALAGGLPGIGLQAAGDIAQASQGQQSAEQQQAQPQGSNQADPFSIIDQYSPEISNALRKILGQGYSPRDAAARLKVNHAPEFGGFIQSIEQQEGAPFPDWINALFGGNPKASQQRPSQQPQQSQAQSQAAPSANAQALMSLLQKYKNR